MYLAACQDTHLGKDFGQQQVEFDGFHVQGELARFGLRQHQQPAHQAGEPACFVVDAAERFFVCFLNSAHQIHIAFDDRQRRTQFVTDICKKPLL